MKTQITNMGATDGQSDHLRNREEVTKNVRVKKQKGVEQKPSKELRILLTITSVF